MRRAERPGRNGARALRALPELKRDFRRGPDGEFPPPLSLRYLARQRDPVARAADSGDRLAAAGDNWTGVFFGALCPVCAQLVKNRPLHRLIFGP